MQILGYSDVQICKYSENQICRYSDIQIIRYSDLQVCRYSDIFTYSDMIYIFVNLLAFSYICFCFPTFSYSGPSILIWALIKRRGLTWNGFFRIFYWFGLQKGHWLGYFFHPASLLVPWGTQGPAIFIAAFRGQYPPPLQAMNQVMVNSRLTG